jgi:ATP-binding cassette subfamily C protein
MPDDQQRDPAQQHRRRPHLRRIVKRARKVARAVQEVLALVPPRQRILVIIGLFFSSMLELLGVTMIIPLLASVTHLRDGKLGLVTAIRSAVEWAGLPFHPVTFLALIAVGLTLKAAVTITVMRYVGDIVANVGRNMQLRIVRGLLRARWSFFVRQPLGRLTNAAGPEAAAVGECFLTLASIFASSLQALLFLAIAALISLELASLALGLTTLMVVFFGRLVRESRNAARQHRNQIRRLGSSLTDAMISIKPLRAMARTDQFDRLFESNIGAMANLLRARVLSSEYASELQEPIIGTIIAGGFLYAATSPTLAPQELLLMSILLVRTISSIGPIQRRFHRFLQNYDQFHSLRAFVAEVEKAAEVMRKGAAPRFEQALTLDGVVFAYDSRRILDELSLVVPRGRITTLAGRSGVGKSTTIDLIAGLHQPSSGRILIDGVDLSTLDLAAWRHMIGYVPQDVTLFHTTILNNISLWEEGFSDTEVIEALRDSGAWPFVEQLPKGLQHVVGERGQRLSGGQRQRLAITRALLRRPSLLILDEATTGLDHETEAEICVAVQRLCREQGLAVLAISHQPAWQNIADRVYWMEKGRTVDMRDRSHSEVLVQQPSKVLGYDR